ncbi:MAG: hypothetical protein HYY16_19410 [Planctomycetes bacterium]|nr:hypothetical protein [Planctomycetota bacterium]
MLLGQATRAMEAGEASEAAEALQRVERCVHENRSAESLPLDELRERFYHLLHRRGFYVSTEDEIRRSVQEIREIGAGFDLYELARVLAQCDVTLTQCLGVRPQRYLPELGALASECGCQVRCPPEKFE